MFSADVLVAEALGFFSGVGEDALAFVGEREVDGGRDFFADGGVRLNLLSNRFDRCMRAQESVGQGLVFAEKAEQKVLRLDIG